MTCNCDDGDCQTCYPKNAERFTLANDKPAPRPATFDAEATRQRPLFAGLDCLPGQRDLFATDGESEADNA